MEALKKKITEIELIAENWKSTADQVQSFLRKDELPEDESLKEFSKKVKQETEKARKSLLNPDIYIASSGTTSSAKSTFINVLAGAEIVPMTVHEMSAGVVSIDDVSGNSFSLKVTKVIEGNNQIIESNLGTINTYDICKEIEKECNEYRRNREKALSEQKTPPSPPLFFVKHPLKINKDIQQVFENPEIKGTVKLMDLPGYNYSGDAENLKVIESNCSQALCVLLYDASVTDKNKQEELLAQIVSQVKRYGGSPKRMLFLLNKYDIYFRDITANRTIEQVYQDIEKLRKNIEDKIKSELNNDLSHYSEDIKAIVVKKICTGPALKSILGDQFLANNDRNQLNQCLMNIESNYQRFITESLLQQLHRIVDRWTDTDCRNVIFDVKKNCGYNDFYQSLGTHIRENLPELIIPNVVHLLKEKAFTPALERVRDIVQARIHSGEEAYQNEMKKREKEETKVNEVLEELLKPFNQVEQGFRNLNDDDKKNLRNSLVRIFNDHLPHAESGLTDWTRNITDTNQAFLTFIRESLENKTADIPVHLSLYCPDNCDEYRQWKNSFDELFGSEYYPDTKIEGLKDDEETTRRIGNIIEKLSQFDNATAVLYKWMSMNFLADEQNSVYSAWKRTHDTSLNDFIRKCSDVSNLIVATEAGDIHQVRQEISIVDLTLIVPRTPEEERRRREETYKDSKPRGFWEWVAKIGGLGIPVFERTRTITDKYQVFTCPSVADMINSYETSMQSSVDQTMEAFCNWFLAQFGAMKSGIENFKDRIFNNYNQELEKARQEAQTKKLVNQQKWKPLGTQVEEITRNIGKLTTVNHQ